MEGKLGPKEPAIPHQHFGVSIDRVCHPKPILPGPLLGLDLWEHAWARDPTDGRDGQLAAFWNVVDWDEVGRRFEAARAAAARRSCQQPQCA